MNGGEGDLNAWNACTFANKYLYLYYEKFNYTFFTIYK